MRTRFLTTCSSLRTGAAAPARGRFRRRGARLLGTALAAGAALAAGCQIIPEAQPDPTRYFLLATPTVAPSGPVAEQGLRLGLRPVELPAYLRNSKSLVVTRGANELAYRDFDRWAEPLDAALGRVFRDTLTSDDRVARVVAFPFDPEQPRDYDLAIRVLRCEGAELAGGRRVARFAIAYEISRAGAGGELVERGTYAAPDAAWDGEASTLAALLGEAAAAAGRTIVETLPQPARDQG